ncbi:MAG: hypothetical protein HDR88_14550 [Bacteroides sp.]|nr:hypothetical protein [Bacteroides sp.]
MDLTEFLSQSMPSVDLPSADPIILKEQEELLFQHWINTHPNEDADLMRLRLQYLRTYVLKYPDFDGTEFFLSEEAFRHYLNRNDKMKFTFLSEEEFYNHRIIQKAIKDLGLLPEPTFEFILYLWAILKKWIEYGKNERVADKIKRIKTRIDENPQDTLSVDFKVGSKHFHFSNSDFIKVLIDNFAKSDLLAGGLVEKTKIAKREADYILITTLLENLPISRDKRKKGTFSQAERNFGLSVLWLTGELNHYKNDDPTQFCSNDNNATFDKLMRDFKGKSTPPVFGEL